MTGAAGAEPGPDLTQAVLREVGPRLRAARLRRDLTLEAVSAETGISTSTLSRLESGRRAPNLELLLPITRLLGVSLDDLLLWRAPDPRVTSRTRTHGGVTVEYLSPPSARTQVLRMTVRPTREPLRRRSHEGHEWFYVLRGRARVVLGERDVVMEAGQAAQFDTRIPHAVAAVGDEPLEVLAMFTRSGHLLHVPDPDPAVDPAD